MVVSFGAVAFKANNQNIALEGHDSHSSNSREPPDGRILLRKAAFCIGRSRFTSNTRILLWATSFCFGQLHFAFDGCIWHQTAAIAFRSQLVQKDKSRQKHFVRQPFRRTSFNPCHNELRFFPSRWLFYIFFKDQSPF